MHKRPTHPGNAEPQLRQDTGSANTAELGLRAPRLPTSSGKVPSIPHAPEWYSRGYLPHRDRIGLLQSITFRLADSLPQEKLQELRAAQERRKLADRDFHTSGGATLGSTDTDTVKERCKVEVWLDAGMGCCTLRHPAMAAVVEDTLLKFDDQKYKLIAWCIMPNHVHVLIESLSTLNRIVQSCKSYTGRWAFAHRAELGLRAPRGATQRSHVSSSSKNIFWMPDYWDRFIRNENHLQNTIDYIHYNPVKAGLCSTPEQWRWSSAHLYKQIAGTGEPQLRSCYEKQESS